MENAFNYVKRNNGLDTEKSYSYQALNGICRYNPKNRGAETNGPEIFQSITEKELVQKLNEIGN